MSNPNVKYYDLFTYTHIPTGYVASTCISISRELAAQKLIYFLGQPWYEWELIKTEKVPTTDSIIAEILMEEQFTIMTGHTNATITSA